MKRLCVFIAGFFLAVGLYAQAINPKIGYKNGITWGMKRNDVNNKLSGRAKLKKLNKNKNPQSYKGYTASVEIYESNPGSADETIVYYYFLDDKLFSVEETLKKDASTIQKLKLRYIGLSETDLDGQKTLWDRSVASDGYITQSISVTLLTGANAGCACVRMYDRETYKIASTMEIPDYETIVVQNIVEALANLAQKLVQSSTKKSTYAFIALTSDNGNALVENYVTDALTEAMFDTGKIKIVERASIEKIMSEQQFQSTALVNENTAVEIGNLSGANFVCYGMVKDLGDQLTMNVKVVEVSTAELCSMGRETVNKDKYLQNVGFEKRKSNAVAANKSEASSANSGSGNNTGTATATTEKPVVEAKKETPPAPKQKVNSVWTVQKKDNGIYTTYTFVVKCAGVPFLFVGYDKFDVPTSSRVKAGIYWQTKIRDLKGTYDIKEDSGNVINKNFSWAWWTYDVGYGHSKAQYGVNYSKWSNLSSWDYGDNGCTSSLKIDNLDAFAFTCNQGESARFFVELFARNNMLTVRHNNDTYRFATEGFWQTVEAQGLTREEIMDAIANEEF